MYHWLATIDCKSTQLGVPKTKIFLRVPSVKKNRGIDQSGLRIIGLHLCYVPNAGKSPLTQSQTSVGKSLPLLAEP